MKYYKVVRKEKRGLFSCVVDEDSGFRCVYEKGKWTEAKEGSLLFVFSSKSSAEAFSPSCESWECEIEGKEEIYFCLYPYFGCPNYKEFWLCLKDKREQFDVLLAPFSTVGAKRVKLIKEIA